MDQQPVPTIADAIQQVNSIDNPEMLRQMLIATLQDMKLLKDGLIQASAMFGLYENGNFIDNPKLKDVLSAVSGYAIKSMNPFSQKELHDEFAFLSTLTPLGKKYQNL